MRNAMHEQSAVSVETRAVEFCVKTPRFLKHEKPQASKFLLC